jgi:Uma2 family endonuclease
MVQTVVDRAAVLGRRVPMTYEAWLDWDVEGVKSEWVAGEAIVFMPATARHWDLLLFLSALLTEYVRFLGLGRVVGDVEMRIGGRGRVPDLLFVRTDQLGRLSNTRLDGPADLVVELISDDSVERDRKDKLEEYAAAGVREYWAIDSRPGEQGAYFYRLDGGDYQPIEPDADGRVWSTVVQGFWLNPAWLWREPLPIASRQVALIVPDAARAALETPETADGSDCK